MNTNTQDDFSKPDSLFDMDVKYLLSIARDKNSFQIKASDLSKKESLALQANWEESLSQWRKTFALIRDGKSQ